MTFKKTNIRRAISEIEEIDLNTKIDVSDENENKLGSLTFAELTEDALPLVAIEYIGEVFEFTTPRTKSINLKGIFTPV